MIVPSAGRARLFVASAAGLLLAAISVAAQAPAPVRFVGDAAPPSSVLSLWYRAPAADRPLTPRPTGPNAAAEWVRALPVGNGRLGAMVFGGVVHERLQLNEDTLWAGRPYDPVNPDAKAALPEVRRLITEKRYADAAALAGKSVMAKPLAQMPYQTLGDLGLTFAPVDVVERYQRDLDLSTATAHVSYTAGGVTFLREVFASAPDQVIVVQLTASRPGQISFEARLHTPQRATTEATADGDLVMRGVNGDGRGATADGQPMTGALRFESRVRVLTTGGTRTAAGDAVVVRDADTATLLIAAATSYRRYDDVSGDPAASVAAALSGASGKTVEALRAAHVRDYRKLFDRVTLDLGPSARAALPADERVAAFASGGDPALAALYFQVRALPAHRQLAPRLAARQSAGHLERQPVAAVGQQVHDQHQHPDELLAGDVHEPAGDDGPADRHGSGPRRDGRTHGPRDVWRRWLGRPPQHGSLARDGPDRWSAMGTLADGRSLARRRALGSLRYTGDSAYLATIYPLLKGAAQFFLDTLVEDPTHQWLVTSPSVSPENPHPFGTSVVIGPTMDQQILRDLFASATKAARALGVDRDLQARWTATRARLAPMQIGSAGQLQEWLGDWDMQAPEMQHRHVSHLYGLFPGRDIDVRRTPALAAAVKRSLEIRGDQATGWATAWRINLWARLGDGDHAVRDPEVPAQPRADLPEPVRCPPAVPDRRELWRRVGHRRDAAPVRRGRDQAAAGAALRLAVRSCHRPARPRRLRGRYLVEGSRRGTGHRAVAARRVPAPSTPRHAPDRRHHCAGRRAGVRE